MKKKALIAILLFSVIALGAVGLRRNLSGLTSQAVSSALSRVLGVSDVFVGQVTVKGIRSIGLADVRMGEAVSIDRVSVDYDIMDIVCNRVGLVDSITGVRVRGVDVDMAVLERLFSEPVERSARKSDRRKGEPVGRSVGEFDLPVDVRDIVVTFPLEGDLCRIEAGRARADGRVSSDGMMWDIALSDVVYRNGQSVDAKNVTCSVEVRGGVTEISQLEAELLGGRVSGGVILRRGGDAPFSITGVLDMSGLSYEELTVSAYVRMDEDGVVFAHGNAEFPEAGGNIGKVEAEYEGHLCVPGVSIGARDNAKPATDSLFEADGVLRLIKLDAGRSTVDGLVMDVWARYGSGHVQATASGNRASMEVISKALGHAIPADGWVDWKVDAEVEGSVLSAVMTIVDGELRSELWPQEFVGLNGSIEVSQTISGEGAGSQVEVDVPAVRATMGGGTIEVSRVGPVWKVRGTGLGIEHQLMRGFADVDAVIRIGDRAQIAGTLRVYDADVDVVTTAFSKADVIPDADLDLDVIVGDGVKLVREESWVQVMPSVVHLGGSVRQPRASGFVDAGPGEVSLYEIPLEILSARVEFPAQGNSVPEFSIVAQDSSAAFPIVATIYGRPGDIHLSFEQLSGDEEESTPGELLMKLLDARLRLYILSRVGQVVNALPGPILH